jgi:hypothetical protein
VKALSAVKTFLFILLALFLGLFQLIFLFSDLGPGETLLHRYTVTILFNFIWSLIIGLANSRVWLIASIVSWTGILIVLRNLFSGPSHWSEMALVASLSPLPALAGGYLGALAIRKRVFGRLFRPGRSG